MDNSSVMIYRNIIDDNFLSSLKELLDKIYKEEEDNTETYCLIITGVYGKIKIGSLCTIQKFENDIKVVYSSSDTIYFYIGKYCIKVIEDTAYQSDVATIIPARTPKLNINKENQNA